MLYSRHLSAPMEHRTTLCMCAGIAIALFGFCFTVCRANCDHQLQELRMELKNCKWQLKKLKTETDSCRGERDESRKVTARITESMFDWLIRDHETSEKLLAFLLRVLIVICFTVILVCMCCFCCFGANRPAGVMRAIQN